MIGHVEPIRFADYDLVHFLGRGGMGEVWSAVKRWHVANRKLVAARTIAPDTSRLSADPFALNKPLALKVMHPRLSQDEEYREMFVAETGITMQLSCANIVSVFEIGEHDGLLYMAMERIDGVNLFDFHNRVLTAGGHMPIDVAVHIIHEILTALFVAHEHTVAGKPAGVVHRDVKPGNIIVSSVGDVLLTDFGIARPATREHTARLGVPGTLRYMAPEHARGFAGKGSDLFAVGAIFQELLTGRRFRDECRTDEDLRRSILESAVVPPLDRPLPAELEYLRRRLLDPDPRRRIQSAREALLLLSGWAGLGNARLKIADLYEQVVGSRSSGFTRAHHAALPSFIVERRARFESDLTVPVFRRCAPIPVEVDARHGDDGGDDDVTSTYEKMPWLHDEPSQSSARSGPETNAPLPRVRREAATRHPIALDDGGRPLPLRPPALTPTELLELLNAPDSPLGGRRLGREGHDTTERLEHSRDSDMRERASRSAAGSIPSEPVVVPTPKTSSENEPRPPHGNHQRLWVTLLLIAVIFGAGVGTALLLREASSADAPTREGSR